MKRLESIIEILKSVLVPASLPLEERVELIEQLQKKYSLRMICDALEFNRGTYYYKRLHSTRHQKKKRQKRVLLRNTLSQKRI